MNSDTIGVLGSNSRVRTVTDEKLQRRFDTLNPGYENYENEGVLAFGRPERRTKMDMYMQKEFNAKNESGSIAPMKNYTRSVNCNCGPNCNCNC